MHLPPCVLLQDSQTKESQRLLTGSNVHAGCRPHSRALGGASACHYLIGGHCFVSCEGRATQPMTYKDVLAKAIPVARHCAQYSKIG